ncbi:iron chelate uptake ABC transporter family permease subunit [Nakamurella sp. YIM 132087]|uniref:Iron chelate uptake ABC transporter family permease subunit n=1 Tax=Nakamurella alba TaxID=2665158 RepID=A0A7K1FV89_9ACTN|nr:iron chelate uptake ABC transporter family permease subunit [Nakamurella alba]
MKSPGTSPDPAPAEAPPRSLRPALRLGPEISFPVHVRSLVVFLALLVITVVVAGWAMTLGTIDVPVGTLIQAVFGSGEDGIVRLIQNWRLPRVVIAIVGGASLGIAGAIFQSLTRNPLGSPDIIGFNNGAYSGALIAILVLNTGRTGSTIGALIGGIVAAAIVVGLATRGGGLQGMRLIVVGIAISAVLASLNVYLILRADLETAMAAAAWGMGIFDTITWSQVLPIVIALVVLVPVLCGFARSLRLLELGDDSAAGLGLNANRTRLILIVVGVGFTAAVTAAAGPILFVALAAPQLARRLTGSAGIPLAASAAMGALLLLVSDVAAQQLLAPKQLPVGVITLTLGGAYLIGLLIAQSRKA